jgi:CubicO group peptidase (beta-lactamase class C family)
MKEMRIPGMQVAVVQKGRIVYSKSLGLANLQDSVPVSSRTIFPINSCTKSLTGVAVLQLVEEKKLELDAPVSRYLDSLPTTWQAVTIRQLLVHISGLPDMLQLFDPNTHGLGGLRTEQAVFEKTKTLPMQFTTGDQFRYNQTNYYLLSKVITKLTGNPFEAVVKQQQLDVVKMPHTRYGDTRDIISHFAPSYRYQKKRDGKPLAQEELVINYTEFPSFQWSSSGLNSTAEDMAHWIIALTQGKLLNKNSLEALWTHGKFNNGTPTPWTPGFGVNKPNTQHRAVGMSGGGRSAFLIYPEDELAVVILTNLMGSSPENFIVEVAGYFNAAVAKADGITALRVALRQRGFDQAMTVYQELKQKNPALNLNEYEVNDLGYRLLSIGKLSEAKALFHLNTVLFPDSWNVYDSYGEALMYSGERAAAIAMYKKSVELNPGNEGGKNALLRLRGEQIK